VQLSASITLTLHKTARKNTASIFTLVAMAVTSAVSRSTSKKSWADIVKGRSEAKVEPLRPAVSGTHRCLCTGEFLVMLGHYGWIMSLQDIDHPEADRHGGRIYLRATDLRPGCTPKQGDEVTFFLYADENGLGAEDCYCTHDPHPPQPPAPPRQHGYSRPKKSWGSLAQHTETRKYMSAAAKEFVPTVLVPLNADDGTSLVTMNPGAQEFVPAPPGLGPTLNVEATDFFSAAPPCNGNTYCPINTKRFYDDDDDASSDDGTESTASDFSGRVLVAPGLSACFVSESNPEKWSTLSSRCAQAVVEADVDSDSWCDDESDDDASCSPVQNRAEEWAAVSARCAQAVGQIHSEHPWHMRNAAAKAKLMADVGNDIRWESVLDALAELDVSSTILPPGLAPPGLAPPGLLPPGLA